MHFIWTPIVLWLERNDRVCIVKEIDVNEVWSWIKFQVFFWALSSVWSEGCCTLSEEVERSFAVRWIFKEIYPAAFSGILAISLSLSVFFIRCFLFGGLFVLLFHVLFSILFLFIKKPFVLFRKNNYVHEKIKWIPEYNLPEELSFVEGIGVESWKRFWTLLCCVEHKHQTEGWQSLFHTDNGLMHGSNEKSKTDLHILLVHILIKQTRTTVICWVLCWNSLNVLQSQFS